MNVLILQSYHVCCFFLNVLFLLVVTFRDSKNALIFYFGIFSGRKRKNKSSWYCIEGQKYCISWLIWAPLKIVFCIQLYYINGFKFNTIYIRVTHMITNVGIAEWYPLSHLLYSRATSTCPSFFYCYDYFKVFYSFEWHDIVV